MHLGLFEVEILTHTPNSFSVGFLKYIGMNLTLGWELEQ